MKFECKPLAPTIVTIALNFKAELQQRTKQPELLLQNINFNHNFLKPYAIHDSDVKYAYVFVFHVVVCSKCNSLAFGRVCLSRVTNPISTAGNKNEQTIHFNLMNN